MPQYNNAAHPKHQRKRKPLKTAFLIDRNLVDMAYILIAGNFVGSPLNKNTAFDRGQV